MLPPLHNNANGRVSRSFDLLFEVLDILGNLGLITPEAASGIVAYNNICFSNPSYHFQNRIHGVSPPLKQELLKQRPL